MTAGESASSNEEPASEQIDAIIEATGGWRSTTLARLRASIKKADPSVVEEVKWRKPSRRMERRCGRMTGSSASGRR